MAAALAAQTRAISHGRTWQTFRRRIPTANRMYRRWGVGGWLCEDDNQREADQRADTAYSRRRMGFAASDMSALSAAQALCELCHCTTSPVGPLSPVCADEDATSRFVSEVSVLQPRSMMKTYEGRTRRASLTWCSSAGTSNCIQPAYRRSSTRDIRRAAH